MRKIIHKRLDGISLEVIQGCVEYFKSKFPNWNRPYKIVYSYHCQGDFCKRYKEIIYID